MADVFDFYVRDNRKITFEIAEPIMREDSGVTDFVFHIPKSINNLDMSDWQWWFVFVNANKEKYSIALTISDDPERPLEYNLATYTVDYAMSIKAGSVQFALEAINAGTGGAIDNEWHTLTYETKVKETLQGNQAEYAETESDVISALLIEVRNKVNQLVGGATPEPVQYKVQMTDPQKVYLYIGSEPNEHAGHWYYYNGTTFVSGGAYGAGEASINTESVLKTYHPQSSNVSAVDVYGNDYAFGNIFIANKRNIIPRYSGQTKTVNGMTATFFDRFVKLTGAGTGTATFRTVPVWRKLNNVQAGQYIFKVKTLGAWVATGTYKIRISAEVKNDVGAQTDLLGQYLNPEQADYEFPVTIPEGYTSEFLFLIRGYAGVTITDTFTVWFGLFPAGTTFTDTGISVQSDGHQLITVNRDLFPDGIDTMQHESIGICHPSVQDYIDTHVDLSLPYVMPEQFGAIGDGVSDDTTAVQTCIDYAIANEKAVRGYRHYATSKPIEIIASYTDIYLHRITYTEITSASVILQGTYNLIRIDSINSYASGFRFLTIGVGSPAHYNRIIVGSIVATGNGIEILNAVSGVVASGAYNRFEFEHIKSSNGNGIHIESSYGEKFFKGGDIIVSSGWSIYTEDATSTFLNVCMESTHGVYFNGSDGGGNTFIGGRFRELTDKYGTDATDQDLGILFKFGEMSHNNIVVARDSVPAKSIKIAKTTSDNSQLYGATRMKIIGANMTAGYRPFVCDGNEILVKKERVVIRGTQSRSRTISDVTVDMRGYETYIPLCTRFVAGIASGTIYLNESYCSVGIDTISIVQSASNKLIIYDSRGVLVFDGTNRDAGEYKATAVFDSASSVYNDAEHDIWILEKLNIIP